MPTLKEDLEALLEGRKISVCVDGRELNEKSIDAEIKRPEIRQVLIAVVGYAELLKHDNKEQARQTIGQTSLTAYRAQLTVINAQLSAAYSALCDPNVVADTSSLFSTVKEALQQESPMEVKVKEMMAERLAALASGKSHSSGVSVSDDTLQINMSDYSKNEINSLSTHPFAQEGEVTPDLARGDGWSDYTEENKSENKTAEKASDVSSASQRPEGV